MKVWRHETYFIGLETYKKSVVIISHQFERESYLSATCDCECQPFRVFISAACDGEYHDDWRSAPCPGGSGTQGHRDVLHLLPGHVPAVAQKEEAQEDDRRWVAMAMPGIAANLINLLWLLTYFCITLVYTLHN